MRFAPPFWGSLVHCLKLCVPLEASLWISFRDWRALCLSNEGGGRRVSKILPFAARISVGRWALGLSPTPEGPKIEEMHSCSITGKEPHHI